MDDLLDLDWGSKGGKSKQQQSMLTLAQQQQQQTNTSTSSATMSSYNFDALTRSMPTSNSSVTSRTHTPSLPTQQQQQQQQQQKQSSSSNPSASFADLVNFGSASSTTSKPLAAGSMASAAAAAAAPDNILGSNGNSDAHLWDFDALGSSASSAPKPPTMPARAPAAAAAAAQQAPRMTKPNRDIFSFLDEDEVTAGAPQAMQSAQPASSSTDPFDFDAFNDDLPSQTRPSAHVPNLSVQQDGIDEDEDDFLGALGKPVQPKPSPSPQPISVDRLHASSPSGRTADDGSSNSSRVPSPVDGGRKRYQDGSRPQQQRDGSEDEDSRDGPEDADRHEGQRQRGGPASSRRAPPQQQQQRRDFVAFEDEERAARERDDAILGGGGGRESPAPNNRRRPREGKSSNGNAANGDASSAATSAATALAATASSLFANAESMAANLFGGNHAGGEGGGANGTGELFGALGRRFGFGTPSGAASPSGRKTDTPLPQSRSPAGARRREPGGGLREPVERFRDGGDDGNDGVLPRHPDDAPRKRNDDDSLRGSESSAPRVSRNRYGVPRPRPEEEDRPHRDAAPAASTDLFRDDDDDVERPEEADRVVPRRTPAAPDRNGSESTAPGQAVSARPPRRPNNTALPARVQRSEAPIQIPRKIVADNARAISAASAAKQAGNEAFKRGNYAEAESHYTRALESLEEGSLRRVVLLNNRAQARLKNGETGPAMRDCDAVLAIIVPPTKASSSSANNVIKIYRPREETPLPDDLASEVNLRDAWAKAVLRRAQACETMERWLSAKSGWDALLQFEKEEGSKNGVGNMRSAKEGLGRCEDMIGGGKKKKKAPAASTTTRRPVVSTAREGAGVARVRQEAAEQAQEEASKLALKDSVDASIVAWKTGKENNIRALLASVSDVVVWPEFGWKKIGMHEVITDVQVKKAYTRAIAKLHPDKLSSKKDITLEQRMVASAVFTVLNEAFTATQT